MLEHRERQKMRKLLSVLGKICIFFLILGVVVYQSANSPINQQTENNMVNEEKSNLAIQERVLNEGNGAYDAEQLQQASIEENQEGSNQELENYEVQDNFEVDITEVTLYTTDNPEMIRKPTWLSVNREILPPMIANPKFKDNDDDGDETDQEDEAMSLETEEIPSRDTPATEYTLGNIARIVEEMNNTERLKVEFTWDEEKFTEDSLFIDYIRDLMARWYEEGKIAREWTPDEERFTSETPYYTEEQGDYITLANLMYAEEGVLIRRCTFDEAILAHLFAGTVVMNRATDEKGRFGENLHDAIYTGSGYPSSTRNRVTNQECNREIVYVLAKMIIQYGPIGPESLIFQSQGAQGIPYAHINNQKFGLERGT